MKDIAVKVIFLFVLMCLKHIQSLKDYTLMFMLAKDYCLCGAKYGEEAPYCYNWLLHGRFVRLIRSQKMSSVSNMACCWVWRCSLAFKASGAQRFNIVWKILSTPEFWWVLVSRHSLFGCMIRPQNISSVSNMACCWRILKVLVSFYKLWCTKFQVWCGKSF